MTYQEKSKNRTKEFIDKQPLMPIQFQGRSIIGKWIEGADIIVRVSINLYDQGFLNRDICRVLAELDYENMLIKRLEDGHEGIIEKKFLELPVWKSYDL